MSGEREFDVVVIGSGGTGYAAASTAAALGRRVAMVEGGKLGGTCLNVGCVPTKTLLRSARAYAEVRRASDFGIEVPEARVNWRAVQARRRAMVEMYSYEEMTGSLRNQGIELLTGWASFLGPHTLRVGHSTYRSERFVIASGSKPVAPNIPGLAGSGALLSDDVLELEQLPTSLLIVGAGIIGAELATIFQTFGTEVTVVGGRLLADEDVGETLAEGLSARGVRLLLGARVVGLSRDGHETRAAVEYRDGRTEQVGAEKVLLGVGRRARYDGLEITAAGVETNDTGIVVGADMRTSVPHVWAAGDVTGMHMYTHAGDHMGEVAGWNAGGGLPTRQARLDVVPRPVYSLPEVAAIGLTENEAAGLSCDVEVAKVRFADISRARIDGETEGWCKVIAERSSGRILGASIVGANANDLIGEVAVAMAGGVSAWTLGDTLHPYPTVSEIVRWTADQDGEQGASATCRQQPCDLASVQVDVLPGSAGAEPVSDDEVERVRQVTAGYGQPDEECVDAAEGS